MTSPGALSISEASRGLVTYRVLVQPSEVVFIKSIIEASDGVASIFAESGGDLTIGAPPDRAAELHAILCDLERETTARLVVPE
jgi:hypothetical protein